jgi:alanyl-tRNA synthetase
VAILSAQKWGKGARVEFVCGGRTVRLLVELQERLARAAEALRCASAEVAEAAFRTAADLQTRRKESEGMLRTLAEAEAERLAGGGGAGVVRAVLVPPGGGSAAWLRAVASGLAGRGRIALLGGVEAGKGALCFARPKGPGPSMGDLLKEAVALLGGKGGGAPELAQGGGPDGGQVEAALRLAEERLAEHPPT